MRNYWLPDLCSESQVNRSYNRRKSFMGHPLFWLAALSVCCLWLGGNVAEGALPAPPSIPDYQGNNDGGGRPTVSQNPSETSSNLDSGSAPASGGLPPPPPASAVEQTLPASPPPTQSPSSTPATTQNIGSAPASGGLPPPPPASAVEQTLPAPPPPAPDSRKQEDAGSGQATAPPSSPVAQQAAPSSQQTDRDIPSIVANFLNNPTSAEEAMQLFWTADSRQNKTEKDYEALHRLLWYARQLGSADATLAYGRLFDPLQPQWWTVQKDAERAMSFYQSVALQNQEAQAAMNRLREWMQSEMTKH